MRQRRLLRSDLARTAKLSGIGAALIACATSTPLLGQQTVDIKVFPTVLRCVDGVCQLNRESLFAMCDGGTKFDRRMQSPDRVGYLLKELNASFGRSLSPLNAVTGGPAKLEEDSERPGFADLSQLRSLCRSRRRNPSQALARLAGPRLDVAAHGLSREYPEFVGTYTTRQAERDNKKHKHSLPGDVRAAAEIAAVVLAEGYDEFDRPVYYEPINEPHWSFVPDEHLAEWHTETRRAVGELDLPVKVGGPCLPVAYFYRNGYKAFDGLRQFIENTAGELDFYSFHVYDYVNWDGADIRGRITSGLPLEGVLDLVQNHAENEYGGPFKLVVSEHGGYITASNGRLTAEQVGELLAGETAADQADEFSGTLYKRSVASHVLVSTAIANTLVFMDHPHVVKKAVPFILPESMGWNPRYYSTMYVPYGFEDRTRWIETRNTDFYKFFRDVSGNRVFVRGGDPDLQVRAFVDGERASVVINNTSGLTHRVRVALPPARSFNVRRYGRNADYTPYLVESETESLETIEVAPREAVVVGARFAKAVPVKQVVNEIPCYGDRVRVGVAEGDPARFVVSIPKSDDLAYAVLRVGVTRPTGASPEVRIRVNGERVSVPVEDAAARLDDGEREYASTKIAMVDPSLLRSKNRVEVSFPDGGDGTVGSVVLRVAQRDMSLAESRVANRP